MKTSLFPRAAVLAGALSLTGMTAIFADDSTSSTPPPPPPGGGHHEMGLTADERAQLKKDRDAAFAANPDLKTEEQNLRQQEKEHMDKVDAAILKEDPSAKPILDKLKAGHRHHGPPPGDAPPAENNQ